MKWLLACILLILLKGYQNPPNYVKLEGLAQGTSWHVTFWSKENINRTEINRDIEQQLSEIDIHMSTYRSNYVISRFNSMHSAMAVEDDILGLTEIAKKVTSKTEGCYDLTIKPLFDLWGFTHNDIKSLFIDENKSVFKEIKTDGYNKLKNIEINLTTNN